MKRVPLLVSVLVPLSITAAGGLALAAQNRAALAIPNGGPAFSDFNGYEGWRYVGVSQTEDGLKQMAGNPAMIQGYEAGGKNFPDGAKMVKIEWSLKKNPESPYFVNEPDTLKSLSFMEKDSKRFASSGGWGYAQFKYDPATDTLSPSVSGPGCGFACHTAVKAKDYVFTPYPKR
jgi:hypothetical protein